MDPILQLLMGLISSNQGMNNGSQMSYDPTGYQAGGLNSLVSGMLSGGNTITRDSSSIPQEFWNALFNSQPNTVADPTTQPTYQPLGQDLTLPHADWQTTGGYGGEIVNPDYTAMYGSLPYDQYLAQEQANEAQRLADYNAYYAANPWTDPYAKQPRFVPTVPMQQYVALWQDPTGLSDPNEYNAFRSASNSIQGYLQNRGQTPPPQTGGAGVSPSGVGGANPVTGRNYRTAGRTMNPGAQTPPPQTNTQPWANPLLSPAEQQRAWNTRPGASPTAGRTMAPPPSPGISPSGVGGANPAGGRNYRTAGRTMAPIPNTGIGNPSQSPYYRTAGRTMNPAPYSPTTNVGMIMSGQNAGYSPDSWYGYDKYAPQTNMPNYGTNRQATLDYIRRRLGR